MRNLVKGITFEAGTRTIHIPLTEMTGVENIRLIVNETQKKVLCSSMQKDLITSCVADAVNGGWNVTYTTDLPVLASGDKLTVEVDLGELNYIDGTDWIAKAKAMPASGVRGTYVVGKEIGKQLTPVVFGGLGLSSLFANSAITYADLSGIDRYGYSDDYPTYVNSLFSGCSLLEYADLSFIRQVGAGGGGNVFYGCNSLKKVILHPMACKYTSSSSYTIMSSFISKADLILTEDVNDINIGLQYTLVNFNTVKEILTRCCNNSMSGHTITFYSNGLTIQDDADGTIQRLYNSVVNTYQANIANLTITPYSA